VTASEMVSAAFRHANTMDKWRNKKVPDMPRAAHPLASPDNKSGFEDRNGQDVRAGDKVRYLVNGRTATLDEAMHDGEAFVTWSDGTHGAVKWNNLIKVLWA